MFDCIIGIIAAVLVVGIFTGLVCIEADNR